ncbi:adenylyl-sulfate kinase [Burkholderia ubonensis]|uniref:Adenylyl-sulfate kinase n=2 Tax=Burkholderia ubonensis TaxID=101571 RepID=A0A124REA0_9BURK|nr:adenylyl-sulfate kinase [Burkholderia ubonensis]KVG76504.1 adenylyl-sulfate kinase [Burkholderia ubonensis]
MNADHCGFAAPVSSLPVDACDRSDARDAGGVLWLTGLSGAGKSTLADALADLLRRRGLQAKVLDGDRLRAGLNRDLGFSERDRFENVRRIAEVASLFADAGFIAIVAAIAPRAAMRDDARRIVGAGFREVHVAASLEVCEARDPKGLYRKARRGELREFTGVSSPYEAPRAADLVLETGSRSLADCLSALLDLALRQFGRIGDPQPIVRETETG